MNLITSSLTTVALLAASAASAQTTYRLGARVGGQRATTTLETRDVASYQYSSTTKKSAITAGQLGLVLEIAKGSFAFQPALLLSQKGTLLRAYRSARLDGSPYEVRREGTTTVRANWVELPLNLVYTLPGKLGLQVFGGPYAAVGVSGRARSVVHNSSDDPALLVQPTTRYAVDIDFGPTKAYDKLSTLTTRQYASRRFDAGFNVGVGYRRGPLQLQAGYGIGLVNLYYDGATEGRSFQSGYNRVAQLTATYFLLQ
jgi:hypothetical protein